MCISLLSWGSLDAVMNHPRDLQLPLLTYANNPSPPLSSSIPTPNTITPRNTKHSLFLGLPRLLPLALTLPPHNNTQLQLQLPNPCLHLYCTPFSNLVFSYSLILYHHYLLRFLLQTLFFTNHTNMPHMYHGSLPLILTLLLSYSLISLISLSSHVVY